MSVAALERTPKHLPPIPNPHFALADDGMPVYTGETDEEIATDWQSANAELDKDHWKLAALSSTIVSKYGEKNVGTFAYQHKTSGRWIRDLARTYRAFQFGKRFPNVSFGIHLFASTAHNPVRAVKIAHDRDMSTRDLKKWIYMGEGRRSASQMKALGPVSTAPAPEVITVEPEEEAGVEDEVLSGEDQSLLRSDIELVLRMCVGAMARAQTKFIGRYLENLQQELDWELEQMTTSGLTDRVESLIRGGCWIPAQLLQRSKIGSLAELKKICGGLEREGKVKWSRERKRKHGTAPEMWMPTDMPDGDEFEVSSAYQPEGEYEGDEHF